MSFWERIFGNVSSATQVLEPSGLAKSVVVREGVTQVEKLSPHVGIVEEIHANFNNAAAVKLRGLNETIMAEKPVDRALLDLKSLGFTSVKGLAEAEKGVKVVAEARNMRGNIMYFQQAYPGYKFVTVAQVVEICEKYGLVCAGVAKYKGEVPKKNIAEMLKFKESGTVKPEDRRYECWDFGGGFDDGRKSLSYLEYTNLKSNRSHTSHYYVNDSFDICAPAKDMDLTRSEKKGHKYEDVPDPVVLYPVRGGYLVVSAWGDEASDENVVNQKMN